MEDIKYIFGYYSQASGYPNKTDWKKLYIRNLIRKAIKIRNFGLIDIETKWKQTRRVSGLSEIGAINDTKW